MTSLTPAGFHPRREFFAGVIPDAGDPSALAQRMAHYEKAHPEETQRRLRAFAARLTPLLARVSKNIQKQFPSRWLTDPEQALRKAKERGRAALLVFCADWAAACTELDKNLKDLSVQQVLDARFVAARVNLTNSDTPSAKSAQKTYSVSGVPELIVFDKTGHAVARHSGVLDVHGLLSLLARAKK